MPQRRTQDYAVVLVEPFLHAVWSLGGWIACIFAFQGLYSCFLRLMERLCCCPQGQQQCSCDSTVPTLSAFSVFLGFHVALMQMVCGPDVKDVLGLTWVSFVCCFLDLHLEGQQVLFSFFSCVSLRKDDVMEFFADVTLHQIWLCARVIVYVDSFCQFTHHDTHCFKVGA